MIQWILAALSLITVLAFGFAFCRAYEEAKDAGYIQTDYEEDRDDDDEG